MSNKPAKAFYTEGYAFFKKSVSLLKEIKRFSSKYDKKMAKRVKKLEDSEQENKAWREGELIRTFKLTRISVPDETPLMDEWLTAELPELNPFERYYFDKALVKAQQGISGWNEEDLKIKFLGPVLELGQITDDKIAISYFDKTISATIDGIRLIVKSDFMLAKGILDVYETPFFHFQEYKPYKNPSGDSMAQLLEAFLIAQEKNQNGKPMYGVDIMGKNWQFVTMEGREYCISKSLDATDRDDLLKIIAILRKFRYILETRLMD